MILEGFRLSSIIYFSKILFLNNTEFDFYKLFFAYISLIFGQSIIFTFWFDTPRKYSDKLRRKRISVLNDNRNLNSYFIFLFAKLSLIIILFLGIYLGQNSIISDFYKEFKGIFILIIIVLYLQNWVTIRILFRNSWKWIIISAVVVSILAFGLSQINFKKFNQLEIGRASCRERV